MKLILREWICPKCLYAYVCVRAVQNHFEAHSQHWHLSSESTFKCRAAFFFLLFHCCCYSACQYILFKPGISVWLLPLHLNIMWWQQKLNELRTWKWTFVRFMDPMNMSHVKIKELKQKIAPSHIFFECLFSVCLFSTDVALLLLFLWFLSTYLLYVE